MAIIIKTLASGALRDDVSKVIYPDPDNPAVKATIIKSMIFSNRSSKELQLFLFIDPAASGIYRFIAPVGMLIRPNGVWRAPFEVTMSLVSSQDRIVAFKLGGSSTDKIEYVLSGLERDL